MAGAGLAATLSSRCDSLEAALAQRDGEIQRRRAHQERAAADLDEARAGIGRKLGEIRAAQQSSEELRKEMGELRRATEALRGARQSEPADLG